MNITILFGTESGNAELVATELAEFLEREHDVDLFDLSDFDVNCFQTARLYLVVCSTHGEGELPQSAIPFAKAMQDEAPDLAGIRYAVFGLGDSTYPNYSRGSEHIDSLLRECGAERVGEYGRHDASGRNEPDDLARAWAATLIVDHAMHAAA